MENDPLEGLLNSTAGVDEDTLELLEQREDLREETIQDLGGEIQEEETSTSTNEQQPQQQQATSTEEAPKEEKGNALKTTAEAALAIPTGTVDWGIGLVNTIIPGERLDLPHIPKFENEVTQSIRDISSVVVPTIFITKGLGGVATKAHAARNWKLGNDVFFKWFAKTGLAGVSGVIADEFAPVQERDHNLAGMLKQSWPQTYGWVSNDWATLDDDEPDIKRKKNMLEGLGIGFAADVLVGAGKLAKSLKGVDKATQWVPENEKAASVLKNMQEPSLSTDAVENVVLQSTKRRYDQLTEIGEVKLDKLNSELPDTRGKGEFYHGAADEFELNDSGQYSSDTGIYGQGLYTTDDLTTANKYQKKNAKSAGPDALKTVYQVSEGAPVNFYDLDQPLDEGTLGLLQNAAAYREDEWIDGDAWIDEAVEIVKDFDKEELTLGNLIDKLRDTSQDWNVTRSEFQDIIDTLKETLTGQGYGGFTHVGGRLAGKGKRLHQVKIYWQPNEQLNKISKVDTLKEPVLGVHDVYDYGESGVRTGDPTGIYGASVDQAKIFKNIDTINGRVGSVMTPGAMDYVVNGSDAGHKLITKAADLLKDSKYGYKASNGKYISHGEILDAGSEIAADLYKLDVPEMDKFLKAMSGEDVSTGARVLDDPGVAGVMKAIKKYSDDFINMDIARAQAYVSTSLAGQVSDMAEGARLYADKVSTVQRAQDQVLDRLQYLMQIKGTTSYARGRALNMLNLWNRASKKAVSSKDALAAIKNEKNNTLKALARIQQESKNTIDTLRAVQKERPEMLGPLMLAYEVTDGKVSTVSALNDYIRNTTGVMKKAFFDGNTDMPSAWTQGMWANIYNSVLSSVGTPLKAGASNFALMVERPIATFAGALLNGDREVMRRGMYMYTVGMGDTLQKAFGHMKQVYSRAARDPGSVGYIMRDDIARKNENTMQLLRSFADAKEAEGMFGPSVITNQIEAMNDLAEHPWMRFSANTMTAFDGFTRSWIGSVEARARAYDTLLAGGKEFKGEDVQKISKGLYDQMFDEKGFISDKAVEYASREIAMNQDNAAVNSLSQLIQRAPVLKPFLMFPKTSMNMLAFTGSHNPLGLIIKDLNAFKHSLNEGVSEVTVDKLLTARGIPLDENKFIAYETIRAELKGRKAIGTLSVLGAVTLFTGDRLHGNGLYDKTRQRTRRELGWKPRSYKGLDGKWYSYENMGALSDWLALTADVMDNFDTLDEGDIETMLNKMGHLLAANLTNKSFTAGLEPLNDVLAGNPAALSRWGASFGSAFAPMSGMRNELGRLLEPQLKEVDQELGQLLANRNVFAKSTLPDLHDWIDGGKVGEPLGFLARVWNVYSPWWKVSDSIGPEKQFLMDIEFDGRPSLRTNGRGGEYTPDQRSEVTDLMGQDQVFKKGVQRIMNSADGKRFRRAYKEAQKLGIPLDRKEFLRIHTQLNSLLRRAQTYAESRMSGRTEVMEKQYKNRQIEQYTKTGETDKIQQLLNPNRNR